MSNQKNNIMRNISQLASSLTLLTLTASLAACGGANQTTTNNAPAGTTGATREVPLTGNVALTGAGASFPAPLYQNWFVQLSQAIPNLQVNYQSVGSGAGVEQLIQQTVDFGASDVGMTDAEIAKVPRGVILLPMTAGSVALAYNLPGVEGLKLPREVYVAIFDGTITRWDDPKIVAANPDLKLPNIPITVVHRADGSGTTEVFTKHLSAISPEWKESIGAAKTVQWPTGKGKFIGGRGNEGVTASLQQNEGTIGYVEYGFAKNNNIPMAALENKAGQFVLPDEAGATAALASETLPPDLRLSITDPPGDASYPIVTYSWLLVNKSYPDPQKAIGIEAMVEYGLTTGQQQSAALGYVPLPPNVVKQVAAAADQITPDYTIKVE
jgi:phosphate transport system substrate-binding protein